MSQNTAEALSLDHSPSTTWAIGVDVDLQVAIALARASAKALMKISPADMRAALQAEVDMLEQASDPLSLAAANLVRQALTEDA
jgi:hypothetical protein